MAKPSQAEIDQMIQYARPTNRDLVRRHINQGINSPNSNLLLKVSPYYYSNGVSKPMLCLYGTVVCQYRGSQYNIPIEIWFQQDHPKVAPIVFVKPTADMHISPSSSDVQANGTVVIPYLRSWRHPSSEISNLLNEMSNAFSLSPPVYSNASSSSHTHVNYSATPYPTDLTAMPTPSMASQNQSYPYPYGYPTQQIPQNIYRESIQTAVLNKVRSRLNETLQMGDAEIESLKRTEQDLINGENKLQSLINEARQQQVQAQNYMKSLEAKTNELLDSEKTKSKSSSLNKENSVIDDALVIPAPVYEKLLQAYSEEHAIQDLLYYLADGLRRESIGLEIYLKHVRELSRKQFMLRATMNKCRHIAGLRIDK